MALRVRPVGFGKQARGFRDLPWRVYADDPNWIPPLRRQLSAQLDPKLNPFLRYGEAQLFLAERDGEAVGRISAQINPEHDAYYHERGGFFGFFECDNDPAVAQALLETAEDWLQARGVDWVRGPVSFTVNQEIGTMVDGFDAQPMVAMPYGRPYYDALITACGYDKVKDLVAWRYPVGEMAPRLRAMRERLLAMDGISVREMEKRHLRRDLGIAVEIFNDAWSENWGFVPVRPDEIDQLAHDLGQFADPQLTSIVSYKGEPVAMVVAIPNLAECARDINGRLFPLGGLKVLWRLWRGPKSGRVILLGIKSAYRTRAFAGLAYMLFSEVYVRGARRGYDWAELGWVLEDNRLLNSALPRFGGSVYKTYRVYQKAASDGGIA